MKKDKAKKKGIFARLMEKIDKKLQEGAKSKTCCGSDNNYKGSSCCNR